MNDLETLVKRVTERVIQALSEQEIVTAGEPVFVIGSPSNDLKSFLASQQYRTVVSAVEANLLVVSDLSLASLRRVALLTPANQSEELLISFLLKKRPVVVLESGKQYAEELRTAPYSMKQLILGSENTWRQFGATFTRSSLKQRQMSKVLSVSQLQRLTQNQHKPIAVPEGTIITPLAKDYIREHKLQLSYQRNEE